MRGLPAAEIVQRNVLRALQPAFRIPRRLAMADVVDTGAGIGFYGYSLAGELESEMSGASGFPIGLSARLWGYTSTPVWSSPNRLSD